MTREALAQSVAVIAEAAVRAVDLAQVALPASCAQTRAVETRFSRVVARAGRTLARRSVSRRSLSRRVLCVWGCGGAGVIKGVLLRRRRKKSFSRRARTRRRLDRRPPASRRSTTPERSETEDVPTDDRRLAEMERAARLSLSKSGSSLSVSCPASDRNDRMCVFWEKMPRKKTHFRLLSHQGGLSSKSNKSLERSLPKKAFV